MSRLHIICVSAQALGASAADLFLEKEPVAALAECKFNLTVGLRIDSNDLYSEPSSTQSADECCGLCSSDLRCKAFLFVAGSNNCWLKSSSDGHHHADENCTAGLAPLGCSSDVDCNMAGRCDAATGICRCDAGWIGSTCERLNLGRAYRCGEGGLCLEGELGFKSTWGGEAIQADDGSYHLYAAGFAKNTTLSSWLSTSRVLHAVSQQGPAGPYALRDVALDALSDPHAWDGRTQHNPAIQRAPDGTYLLYYMGAQDQSTSILPDVNTSSFTCPMPKSIYCMQRVGLATSSSPDGPWTRRDAPIVLRGAEGSWDDLFTTNPTPHVFQNGSVLLLYKAVSSTNPSGPQRMKTGVAFAEHWAGPYVHISAEPINLEADCEDAGIYYSAAMDVFRIVVHCGCNYQAVWSTDGLNWTPGPLQTTGWCNVKYADGSQETLNRRERPKFLVGSDGAPTHLFNGVVSKTSHKGLSFTMVQEILP